MGKQTNFYVLGILLLGSLFYSGCATNPVSGKKDFVLMSEAQEINLGKQAHQQVMKQYRPYNDPALQSYVEGLVDELGKKSHRANLVYHVTVLDSPQINAFALPGGYLYITRGIMAYMNSEAELAGVLGHELGHITARHGVRQQSAGTVAGILGAGVGILTGSGQAAQAANIGSTALIRGYGRSHELEADRLGAEYLANVGYDPQEMLNVVEILKDQEEFDKQLAKEEGREPRAYHGTFSTHPANDARLQEVVGAANNIKTAATREAGREKFLKYMDGAVLGTSEQDGVIRKNKFYHTDLNLFVEFPEGWKVDNLPDRLIAQPKTSDAQLQITVDDLNKKQTPKEYLNEQFKGQIS
ncbi:MAG: M48 family metalloprotease, partial [Gammaproteobacteria bacterium]|nr:M48 family metalloprotease [Gammaproteobacteria bacterium]